MKPDGCKFGAKIEQKELTFEGVGGAHYYMGWCPSSEPVVAIRRASLPLAIDREVCPGGHCPVTCTNWEREAPILLLRDGDVTTLGLVIGNVVGEVYDLPVPPVPYEDLETGELRWTRFALDSVLQDILPWKEARKICRYPEHCQPALVGEGGLVKSIGDIPTSFAHVADCSYEGFSLLAARYEPGNFVKVEEDLYWIRHEYAEWDDPRFPGQGRLLGEEFRIREVEGDYLRLVGRGGDERVAWDFVLGVLETGEWVVMGDDGLYIAEHRGGRVVVTAPYRGSLIDVRGPPSPTPPLSYRIPSVRRAAERVERLLGKPLRRLLDEDVPNPELYLRWPLVRRQWQFKVVLDYPPFQNYIYRFRYAPSEDGPLYVVYRFEPRLLIPLGVRECRVGVVAQERPGHIAVVLTKDPRERHCFTLVDEGGKFYVAVSAGSYGWQRWLRPLFTARAPPADFPSTPLPVGGGWSRLVHPPEPFLDFPDPIPYNPHCASYYGHLPGNCQAVGSKFPVALGSRYHETAESRYPGRGRLVGEEFRVKEVVGDYLRLVGRGGDERVAWDFVYGVLDSGEWVLMGEDGLYLAEHGGGRVVVQKPYEGSLSSVRGPPYGLLYPVVVGGVVEWPAWAPRVEVDAQLLLRWPLAQPKWGEGGLEFYGAYGLGLVGKGVRVRLIEAKGFSVSTDKEGLDILQLY